MYMHQPERNRALLLLAAQANDTFNLQLACVTALAEEEEDRIKTVLNPRSATLKLSTQPWHSTNSTGYLWKPSSHSYYSSTYP